MKNLMKKYLLLIKKCIYGAWGCGSEIQKPVVLMTNKKNIFIGRNVHIKSLARIEPIIKWKNQTYNPRIAIEDNVVIEQGVHIICANSVCIHNNVLISSWCFITDLNHEYKDICKSVIDQGLVISKTVIKENAFLGTGVKVMPGVTIGKHSVIGANSVVTENIPDYCVAVGIPAKVIKKYDFIKKEWIKI